MTLKKSISYVNMAFEFYTELVSYSQDITDNGVFDKSQFEKMSDKDKINVAKDVQYTIRQEVY